MTNMKTKAVTFLLGLLALALPSFAQPTFTITTLSAAINSNVQTLTVASASGITANTTILRIDDEFLGVSSVSGTTIGVRRGQQGTPAQNHGSGRAVYIAPPQNFSACGGTAQGNQPCGIFYNRGNVTHFGSGPWFPTTNPATVTTAGAATYTPGQLLGQLILRDPNGASRSDVLPTAALLVAAIPGATIGTSFVFTIRNDADAAETITVTAGTGGTVTGGGTMTIAQSNMKGFLMRFTAVAPGSEAYIVYSLGTVVF